VLPKAIYNILSGDATIASLVSDRIYPDMIPEDVTTPEAIRYSELTIDPTHTKDGANDIEDVEIRVDCYGGSRDSAAQIAEAVKSAMISVELNTTIQGVVLDGIRLNDRQSFYEPETAMFRVVLDFWVRVKIR